MSHTYALLPISAAAYAEIRESLRSKGYEHTFDGEIIDMHGIALVPAAEDEEAEISASSPG